MTSPELAAEPADAASSMMLVGEVWEPNRSWPATSVGVEDLDGRGGVDPLGYAIAKRICDIGIALALLLATSPLWLLIAVCVGTTSSGGILFRQTRIGRGGRPFVCLKFRTMVPDAETRLKADPILAALHCENWKLSNDPRVTGIGRVLRKTSLDELPQLLNILQGEMSVVGPRPVQLQELEDEYGHWGPVVFRAKPGLTGLWQVSGRSDVTYAERVALDLEYVRQRGLWLDLKIVAKTVPAMLVGRGAV